MIQSNTVKSLPADDQPRQKAMTRGLSVLTDTELLAILIATGSRELSALDLARRLYTSAHNDLHALAQFTINQFRQEKGVGDAKALTLAAAMELGRRRMHLGRRQMHTISASSDVYQFMASTLIDKEHEEVWLLMLNQSGRVLRHCLVGSGGMTGAIVDPKLIMRFALENRATRIILVHNHPSGSPRPSQADIRLTQKIKHGAQLLDIQLTDHVIVAKDKYFSFMDEGML